MTIQIETFADLFERWGGIGPVAETLGVPYVTAQLMKHRNSIAVDHWVKLIDAAPAHGFELDWPTLMQVRERSKAKAVA